jgi:hypothetical protein
MTFAHNIESFTGNRIAAGEPAALAGLVTAMGLGIPAGVVIGAAALILGQTTDRHVGVEPSDRSLVRTTGASTHTPVEAKT